MSKVQEIINRANATVGLNRNQLGMPGTFAWCANYVSEVLRYVGITMYDLSCTRMQRKMKASAEWDEPDDNHPIPGDILFFDWDHKEEELPLDHVGIVTDYENGEITYVNGNGSDSFRVTRQTMKNNNPTIEYWMRFIGEDADNSTPKKDDIPPVASITKCTLELEVIRFGMRTPSTETMQNLLVDVGYNLEVDGIYGSQTKDALEDFQRSNNLVVDGICGAKTWKALIEAI